MKCLYCGSDQSQVVDKRDVKTSGEIRRRRECLKCHRRYTTYERLCAFELNVIKRNGKKEVYSREKLKKGLEKALEKRPGLDRIEEIIVRIETRLKNKGESEVESKVVGRAALSELRKVDKVAYLRFASVYRQFKEIGDFAKELQHLG